MRPPSSVANGSSIQCTNSLNTRFRQMASTDDQRVKSRAKRMVKRVWRKSGAKYTQKNKLAMTYGDAQARITLMLTSAGMNVYQGGAHATTQHLPKRVQSHSEGFASVLWGIHKPLIRKRLNKKRVALGLGKLPKGTYPPLVSTISLRAPCTSSSGGTPQGCGNLPEDAFGDPTNASFFYLKLNSNTPTELKSLTNIGETNDEDYDIANESDDEVIDSEMLKGNDLDDEITWKNAGLT